MCKLTEAFCFSTHECSCCMCFFTALPEKEAGRILIFLLYILLHYCICSLGTYSHPDYPATGSARSDYYKGVEGFSMACTTPLRN